MLFIGHFLLPPRYRLGSLHVSGGEDFLLSGFRFVQDGSISLEIERFPGQRAKGSGKQFPSFDPIEEFEEEESKDHLLLLHRSTLIGDLLEAVLGGAVTSPKRASEFVLKQYFIGSPRARLPL